MEENKEDVLNGFKLSEQTGEDVSSSVSQSTQGAKPEDFKYTTPKLSQAINDNFVLGLAVKDNVEGYSKLERAMGKLGNSWKSADLQSDIGNTAADIMFYQNGLEPISGFNNPVDYEKGAQKLVDAESQMEPLGAYDREGDLFINIPAGVSSAIYQMGEAITDNPKLALGSAGAGLIAGPLGSIGTMFAATSGYQNFRVTAGTVYKNAWLDPSDEEIKSMGITKQEAMWISLGTAAATSSIEFISVGALTKGAKDTFLKSKAGQALSTSAVINSLKKGINKPTIDALKKLGQGIASQLPEFAKKIGAYTANAVVTQGVPEVAQDVTQKLGTDLAMNKPVTVANALDYTFSADSFQSLLIGAAVKPTTDAGAIVVGNSYAVAKAAVSVDRKQGDDVKLTQEEVVLRSHLEKERSQLQKDEQVLKEIIDIEKQITIKDNPAHQEMMDQLDTDRTWYISKDSLLKLEEKTNGFLNTFENVTGYQLTDENETYSLTGKSLRQLFKRDSEIAQMISHTPAGRNLKNFEQVETAINKNKAVITDVLKKLGKPGIDQETQTKLQEQLTKIIDSATEGVKDIDTNVSRDSILSLDTVELMTMDEIVFYDREVIQGREESARQILKEEKQREQMAIGLDVQEGMIARTEQIEKTIAESSNYRVEELFDPATELDPALIDLLKEAYPNLKDKNTLEIQLEILNKQKTKALNKYSIFAFDPETLPPELRDLVESKRIKDKKAFVKGGINWGLAGRIAQHFGIANGAQGLFDNLISFNTKDEYRTEEYQKQLGIQFDLSESELKSTDDDFFKAFEKKARVFGKEIDFLMREKTGAVRKMVAKLGNKWRATDPIKRRAERIAKNIKLRDLNPKIFQKNQYNFGKKVHERFASGDFFEMLQFKKLQMLNALLEGFAVRYRKIIEAKSAKVKRLSTKDARAVLTAAGPEYVKAFDVLRDAFDGKPMGTSKLQEILEIYKPFQGAVTPEFGTRIVSPREVKVQQGDLTFNQAEAILDAMIGIHGLAKNAVSVKVGDTLISKLEAQRQVAIMTRSNPLYDAKESESIFTKDYSRPITARGLDALGGLVSAFTTYYTTIQNRLDRGNVNGFFSQVFVRPLVEGLSKYSSEMTVFNEYLKQKVKETVGTEAFEKYPSTIVDAPEFSSQFKNGITKFEILSIAGHLGSESGRAKMAEFFKLDPEQLPAILSKYLKDSDFRLIEAIHTYFDTVRYPEIKARYERLGQIAPEKVEGLPYKIKGKEFSGGYWPLKQGSEMLTKTRRTGESWLSIVQNKQIGAMLKSTDIATKSGTELERTGLGGPWDLSYEGFNYKIREQLHHSVFSEPMIEIAKLLSDDQIVVDMVNVMGKEQFANMVGSLEHFALGSHDYDVHAQIALEPAIKWFNQANKNLNVATMGFGIMTGIRQYNSYGIIYETIGSQLKEPMSVDQLKNITSSVMNTIVNPVKLAEVAEAIAVVDPQFKNYVEALKKQPLFNKLFSGVDVLDMRRTNQGNFSKAFGDFQDFSLSHLALIQLQLNVAAFNSAYQLAMQGKIKDINPGDKQASRTFAGTVVRISLSDDSPLGQSLIQRQWFGKLLLFGQNQLNILTNRIIGAHQRMGLARNTDGFDLTNAAFFQAMTSIMVASVVPAVLGTLAKTMWKNVVKVEGDEKEDEEETTLVDKGMVSAFQGLVGNYPVIRQLGYMTEQVSEYNREPSDIKLGNIFSNTFGDIALFGFGAGWAALDMFRDVENPRTVSKQEVKMFTRSLLNLLSVPGMNLPPVPVVSPYGKNLRNSVVDYFVDQTELVNKYKFTVTQEGEAADVENPISAIVEMVSDNSDTTGLSIADFNNQAFDASVKALQQPGITEEQKQVYSVIRDRTFSVKGYTNPEGDKITTTKGEVDLSDYTFREDLTTIALATSMLETANFTKFESPTGAKGYYQFTRGTWAGLRNSYPEFKLPADPNMASRELQTQVYWKLIGENIIDLRALGQKPTLDNLFLIHMLGGPDFKKFVNAGPKEDLETLLPVAFESNPLIMAPGTVEGVRTNVLQKMETYVEKADEELLELNLLTLN